MDEKTVVITGGQGGIAQAIAKRLLSDKKVAYNVLTPNSRELDVSDMVALKLYFNRLKQPDILINCAGYIAPGTIKEVSWYEINKHIAINLTGAIHCTQEVLHKNENAIIVNIGSSAGIRPRGKWSLYCATKAGLISFTKSIADEGVKAICVSPGKTNTKMREALFPDEDKSKNANPDDVAGLVMNAINGVFQWGTNLDMKTRSGI